MRIWGVMVTRNEADRYLLPVLNALDPIVDDLFILDDESTDNTVAIAKDWGASVLPAKTPFMKNESLCREEALHAMETLFDPRVGDWVLSLDADEMLAFEGDPRKRMEELAALGKSIRFRVAEVFRVEDGKPFIRTDGFWGDIDGVRFYPWHNGGTFENKTLAGGSIPTYAQNNVYRVTDPVILHYGYAREEDRVKKYARYIGTSGHNTAHVDSILRPPTLKAWKGSRLAVPEDV